MTEFAGTHQSDTHQKALRINLDPRWYGTIAEIGAGQEVARWFFRVGGAAGTIASSISAYDMAVSDAVYGKSRRDGATVFLDTATMEPCEDQWAFLSTLGRMTPREAVAAANRAGRVTVGSGVERISAAASTKTRPECPPVIHARLGPGIRLEQSELTPVLLTTLKHAASMPNPLFYERQRLRISTWGIPRFLQSFDETLDGGLTLPRGLAC